MTLWRGTSRRGVLTLNEPQIQFANCVRTVSGWKLGFNISKKRVPGCLR